MNPFFGSSKCILKGRKRAIKLLITAKNEFKIHVTAQGGFEFSFLVHSECTHKHIEDDNLV